MGKQNKTKPYQQWCHHWYKSEFDNKFPEALKPVVAIITYSK